MRKSKVLLFIFILVSVDLSWAQTPNYGWPVTATEHNGEYRARIAGTPSEYRRPYGNGATIFGTTVANGVHRFHQGVDVSSVLQGNVYSIESGTYAIDFESSGYNSRILLNGVIYWHVEPNDDFLDGVDQISENDLIGTMYHDHVHMQPSLPNIDGTDNYLLGKLPNVVDNSIPVITGSFFYSNGHRVGEVSSELNQEQDVNYIAHTLLYEKVDMLISTDDERVGWDGNDYANGVGNIGVNRLGYEIKDHNNLSLTDGFDVTLDFSTLSTHYSAQFVFGDNATAAQPFYVLTSALLADEDAGIADRFWNTRLRAGQTEDWDLLNRTNKDARINLEAEFPDDKYTVHFRVWDLDEDGADNGNPSTIEENHVLIDNFRPYVKEVLIKRGNEWGEIVYHGKWEWNGSALVFNWEKVNDARSTDAIWIKITTSEPVQDLHLNIDGFDTCNDAHCVEPEPGSNDTEYIYAYASGAATGEYTLKIQAEDLAGNPLQTDPNVLSIHQADNTWVPAAVPGTDENHKFNVGTYSCSSGSSSGRIASKTNSRTTETSSCLYVDFGADTYNPDVNEPVTFVPIASGSGALTYSWNFGQGAIPTVSNSQDPVTVVYTSTGPKNVTLEICDANECNSKIASSFVNVGGTNPQKSVDFTAGKRTIYIGESVGLNSLVSGTVGSVSYTWGFGAGGSGTISSKDPQVSYTTEGYKTISLRVRDANGYEDVIKNNYIRVIPRNVFGIQADFSGNEYPVQAYHAISLSNQTIGGNGFPYQEVTWNFGDDSYAYTWNATHTYESTGTFNIKLKVCDITGCDEITKTIQVNAPGTGPLEADFLVNGQEASSYDALTVGLNTPVTFTDVVSVDIPELGGVNYNWDFDTGNIGKASPGTSNEKGPVQVVYKEEAYYSVALAATQGLHYDREEKASVIDVKSGQGAAGCVAKIHDVSITQACYNENATTPELVIGSVTSNCPIYNVQIITRGVGRNIIKTSGFSSEIRIPLDMSSLSASSFPFTEEFDIYVHQTDGTSNPNRIGYYNFTYTFIGSNLPNADAGANKDICLGESAALGVGISQSNVSFSWSADDPEHLQYLSSVSSPTVSFSGVKLGTYNYRLTLTDESTGCQDYDDVRVRVGGFLTRNRTYYLSPNASTQIKAPVSESGISPYSFSWTPFTYLNSGATYAPTLTAPATEGEITYLVEMTDNIGCTATASVQATFLNGAPGDLKVDDVSDFQVYLSWSDNSPNESSFTVERSVNNALNFVKLSTLPAGTTMFTDNGLEKETLYYYRVRADGLNAYTNEVSVRTLKNELTLGWQARFGGIGSDRFNSIDYSLSGGYILAGSSGDTGGDRSGDLFDNNDVWVVDVDECGNIVWEKSFGGDDLDSHPVIRKWGSNYLLVFSSWSAPGSGNRTALVRGDQDILIYKLNANGGVIWNKSFGSPHFDFFRSMDLTSDGGAILAAYTKGSMGLDKSDYCRDRSYCDYDLWLVKIDGNGNKVWDKTYGGDGLEYVKTIKQTPDGGYIVGGSSTSDNDGHVKDANSGGFDFWVMKLDAGGHLVWSKLYGGYNRDEITDIQLLNDGYLIAGRFNGSHRTRVCKIDLNGSIIWSKSFYGETKSIVSTLNRNYFLTGWHGEDPVVKEFDTSGDQVLDRSYISGGHHGSNMFEQTLNVGDGSYITGGKVSSTDADVPPSRGGSDYWLVQLTESNRYFSGTFSSGDYKMVTGAKIFSRSTVNVQDGAEVAIEALSKIRLGPGTTISEGSVFSAKIVSQLSDPCSSQSLAYAKAVSARRGQLLYNDSEDQENDAEYGMSMYPNPSKGRFNLSVKLKEKSTDLEVVIINNVGVAVYKSRFGALSEVDVDIDLSHLSNGLYSVKVFSGSEYYFKKLIID